MSFAPLYHGAVPELGGGGAGECHWYEGGLGHPPGPVASVIQQWLNGRR